MAASLTIRDGLTLWVTGGRGATFNQSHWNSTEMIQLNPDVVGKLDREDGPEMPINIKQHCLAHLNDTHAIAYGGTTPLHNASWTWLFNFKTESWSVGPKLNQGKKNHVCGSIVTGSGSVTVVADRGYTTDGIVEIWQTENLKHSGWTIADNFPRISFAAIVSSPLRMNSLYLVGGCNQNQQDGFNKVYQFKCNQTTCDFREAGRRLKVGKCRAVAFFASQDRFPCKQKDHQGECNH